MDVSTGTYTLSERDARDMNMALFLPEPRSVDWTGLIDDEDW